MTFTEPMITAEEPKLSPQMRHFNAAALLEKAVTHHRNAARLHEAGDTEQAATHANIARRHNVAALMACDLNFVL
jgi:hypothetical protein